MTGVENLNSTRMKMEQLLAKGRLERNVLDRNRWMMTTKRPPVEEEEEAKDG